MSTTIMVAPGQAYRSSGASPSTTAQTTIYTQGPGYSVAASLRATNTTGTAATLTLDWYDASDGGGTAYTILSAKSISANTAEDIGLGGLGLDKDDEIRVTVGTASAFDLVLTLAQTAGRSGS